MTKRFIFLMLAMLFTLGLQAQTQEKYGRSYDDAIPVAFSLGESTFSDVRNTAQGPPWYYSCRYIPQEGGTYQYTQGGAVFYRMDTSASGNVTIHNWNSERGVAFTTIFIVRLTKTDEVEDWSEGDLSFKWVAAFNERDCMEPDFDPVELGMPEGASLGQAYLRIPNLPADTYYIVTAGYKYMNGSVPNGQLKTTIIADLSSSIPDEPELKPEEVNNSPVQYQYDLSGNRTKTIKKQ